MGHRRIVVGLLGLLLCAASVAVAAADREIDYTIADVEGHQEITVSTPLAEYVFSEEGGVLKFLYLTFAPYGANVEELVPRRRTDPDIKARQYDVDAEFPFALVGETATEGIYALQEPTRPEEGTLEVSFVGAFGEATVTKRYTIHEDAIYTVDVRIIVENPAEAALDLTMILGTLSRDEDTDNLYYMYNGEPGHDRLATSADVSFDGLGVMSKAVVLFLSEAEGTDVEPFGEPTASGTRRFGVSMTAEGGTTDFRFSLYGGRRRYLLMEEAGLAALDQPGIAARMMIPVIQFLSMLYRATGNYGWAIILFTILTRVILFPLMRKQYHSMAKMQKVQPKMKRIQERFKDDRQLQQQKVMELYRKEGINPMSGCLPLLVQLPILILIWRAILYSGELIHLSPGFLWIPDLSMADPYFILVIVTTGIMMLQQWLMSPTGSETSGTQKYFGYIFPLFMAVLLWRFPAGLWLYYLLTTATQVAQQAIVNREMAAADARLAPAADTEETEEIEAGDDNGDGDAGAEEGR